MKFALVEGSRREAEPGLSGICESCDSIMVSKCGEQRVWHWAHRSVSHCDHWWENETEWHRTWKNRFPAEWQEVVHRAEEGEKHIADVKTMHGRVIEFQHSYLKAEECRSREAFYGPMVWVVDGLRRIRDKPSFGKALCAGRVTSLGPLAFVAPSEKYALLRDWADSRVDVYFDFGSGADEIIPLGVPVLWRLYPKSPDGGVILISVPPVDFVEALHKGMPLKGMNYTKYANALERVRGIPTPTGSPPPATGPLSFRQHVAHQYRARSRRRM